MAVNMKQNADASMGLEGTDGGDGGFITHVFNWSAITNTSGAFLTVSGAVFSRRMVVKSITYVNDTAATNAVTAALWKAPSGTALASGVALHTGTVALNGTAATNNSLTLSTVAGALDVAAGSRIGFVISGTPGAAGVGTITVTLAPA